MVKLICKYCSKEFNATRSKYQYCSYECYHASLHKTNEYIIKDEYAILVCNSKKYGQVEFIIDKDDVERCKKYNWYTDCSNKHLYAKTNIRIAKNKQTHIKLHRYLMNCPEGKVIDHINRNTLDNRKNNLRICKLSDNNTNRKDNASGRCGVYFNKECNKWYSRIQSNGIQYDLGMFQNKNDAIKARENAEKRFNVKFIGEQNAQRNQAEPSAIPA